MTDLPPAATTAAVDAALRALIDALRYGPGVHLSIQEARTVLEVVLPHLPPPPPDTGWRGFFDLDAERGAVVLRCNMCTPAKIWKFSLPALAKLATTARDHWTLLHA